MDSEPIFYKVETQIFNGQEYHRYKGERYFTKGLKKLHREVWKFYHGDIPKGYHIHHKDENTANNDISNLEMIEGHKHMSMHMQERMQDPKFVETLNKRMDYAREFANKWHGSPEGIEWHRKHGAEVAKNIKPVKFVCEYCGKEFFAKPNGGNRFCSNKCKSGYRLHSGVDNETRTCIICGKEFTINKYYKIRTCSRECGFKLLSQETKGKIVKLLPQKQSICPKCGKPMMVNGYSRGKLCDDCKRDSILVISTCEVCGKEFEHSKYNNARFCSMECVGRYNTMRKLAKKIDVDLKKLIQLRLNRRMSQKAVGKFLGMSQGAYRDYERGDTIMKKEILEKLCELFRVELSELKVQEL